MARNKPRRVGDYVTLVNLFAFAAILLVGCGGGGDEAPLEPTTFNATSGSAQKGPLVSGSRVVVRELDATLKPTGVTKTYTVTSRAGGFLSDESFAHPLLSVEATGAFIDEAARAESSGPTTLVALVDLRESRFVNANVLTTIAEPRIRRLVAESGLTLAAARRQAEIEVTEAFGLPRLSVPFSALDLGASDDGGHLLLALSSTFAWAARGSVHAMNSLTSELRDDLADGSLSDDSTHTQAALRAAAMDVDVEQVAGFANELLAASGVVYRPNELAGWLDRDGDQVVERMSFVESAAGESSRFVLPKPVLDRLVGHRVAASAGHIWINGALADTRATIRSGDSVAVSPGTGAFPGGAQAVYVRADDRAIAKVTFERGIQSLVIIPASLDIPIGATRVFGVTGTYTDGSTGDATSSVAWSSSMPAVAHVDAFGRVRGAALGSVVIGAATAAASTSAIVTVVAAAPERLMIDPEPAKAGPGVVTALHASVVFTDGRRVDATTGAQWSVADTAIARIDAAGRVTGVAVGSTTAYAAFGSLQATVPLEITSGRWVATRDAPPSRVGHTATLLGDGKVLVVGGRQTLDGVPLATAEIFDPVQETWRAAPPMLRPRDGHSATLLSDGRVLVAGGSEAAEAEIYDPAADAWSSTGAMSSSRAQHSATRLPTGKVLVAGGTNGGALATVELFDPASLSWTPIASMAVPSYGHTATLLPDGRVLVVGGMTPQPPTALFRVAMTARTELYDPMSDGWTPGATIVSARTQHAALLRADGRVVVIGGRTSLDSVLPHTRTVRLYDPPTDSWTSLSDMNAGRSGFAAVLLPDGRMLAVGGNSLGQFSTPRTEVWSPDTGRWTESGPLIGGRAGLTATLILGPKVLSFGGYPSSGSGAVEPPAELWW